MLCGLIAILSTLDLGAIGPNLQLECPGLSEEEKGVRDGWTGGCSHFQMILTVSVPLVYHKSFTSAPSIILHQRQNSHVLISITQRQFTAVSDGDDWKTMGLEPVMTIGARLV
jgi:hypothetical protein